MCESILIPCGLRRATSIQVLMRYTSPLSMVEVWGAFDQSMTSLLGVIGCREMSVDYRAGEVER